MFKQRPVFHFEISSYIRDKRSRDNESRPFFIWNVWDIGQWDIGQV